MQTMKPIKSEKEILDILSDLPLCSELERRDAMLRQENLLKPPRSLGQLEDIAVFLSGWGLKKIEDVKEVQAIVFAGNHGVCDQSVNPFPQEVTFQMVETFREGKAAINKICELNDINLNVIPINLERPTADITLGPAMHSDEFIEAFNIGIQSISSDIDLVCLGEMGIGNTTISSALCYHFFGGNIKSWVGPGTGADVAQQLNKEKVIKKALKNNQPNIKSSLSALYNIGGREQAAICGALLASRYLSIPVILDGFVCTAAVLPLAMENRNILDHCLIGHCSKEPGHKGLVEKLGKEPILNLDMALGEGSGAALSVQIIKAALKCHSEMATFQEAGVSGKS